MMHHWSAMNHIKIISDMEIMNMPQDLQISKLQILQAQGGEIFIAGVAKLA